MLWFQPSIHNSSIDAMGDTGALGVGLNKLDYYYQESPFDFQELELNKRLHGNNIIL